jgi:lipopolysaccharide/colanic/teichoic acid biosynthesis glycosyltransferase
LANLPRLRFSKRLIDLSVCLVVLPFALVLMVAMAVLIALDSPGSPFFTQERIGYCGKRFRLFKFRTMVSNHSNEQERTYMREFINGQVKSGEGVVHKPIQKGDITRLGRILRKTSLDELPQIINVLKGDMSLIGPRPNVPWEVDAYKPWHHERLNGQPGITGLAQVMGRSSISFDQIARYDIQYIRQQSVVMDMRIMWMTVATVISGRGAG